MTQPPEDKKDNGLWVLWSLLIFFATFASVDAYFVYTAVTTHTGVIDDNSYEDGLAYDQFLEKAHQQKSLGVTLDHRYENNSLIVNLMDKNGQPIDGARISALLIRPVQEGYDFKVSLQHMGRGLYEVPLNLPLKGQWMANLDATWIEKATAEPRTYQTAMTFMNP